MADSSQVRIGTAVVGSDGGHLGHIREVRDCYLSVDRAAKPDVYVPFSEIQDATADRIVLKVPATEIDNLGWSRIPVP